MGPAVQKGMRGPSAARVLTSMANRRITRVQGVI
eukprot:COSAG01_NODE_63906_length_278_cov_0.865922_1_plen_33_part_10